MGEEEVKRPIGNKYYKFRVNALMAYKNNLATFMYKLMG